MNYHLQIVHKYLKEKASLDEIQPSGLPFITISREAGAGGHLLAHVLLTDFLREPDRNLFGGWHVFDRELCELVADDPELLTSMEELVTEEHRSEVWEFIDGLISGKPRQYMRYKRTFHIIRLLALVGKVIIVGRAGCCVTRDVPLGIRMRLVAPEKKRVQWMMGKLHTTREKALETIRKQEEDRQRMMRSCFSRDISDPLLYDAVWNTDSVNPHEISHSVIEMLRFREARGRQP